MDDRKATLLQQTGGHIRVAKEKNLPFGTLVPGLNLSYYTKPERVPNCFYHLSIGLIVNGDKRVIVGSRPYAYGTGTMLVTSVEIPSSYELLNVTPENPFIVNFAHDARPEKPYAFRVVHDLKESVEGREQFFGRSEDREDVGALRRRVALENPGLRTNELFDDARVELERRRDEGLRTARFESIGGRQVARRHDGGLFAVSVDAASGRHGPLALQNEGHREVIEAAWHFHVVVEHREVEIGNALRTAAARAVVTLDQSIPKTVVEEGDVVHL